MKEKHIHSNENYMLSDDEIGLYKNKGYLVIKDFIDTSEVEMFEENIQLFQNYRSLPNVICEDNGDIRSIFSPHQQINIFEKLFKDKNLINSGKQLIGDDIYLYQYKLNLKKSFTGNFWEWHQDFPYWHYDDGIRLPKMISIMILLDNTDSYQGPLLVIPGSHKGGIAKMEVKKHMNYKGNDLLDSLSSDLKYTISRDLVKKEALKHGIVPLDGPKGTAIFFHPNIFHASNSNVSPFNRSAAIITYNSVENIPIHKYSQRPEYICSRDFRALDNKN